jgi:hypothetical protein
LSKDHVLTVTYTTQNKHLLENDEDGQHFIFKNTFYHFLYNNEKINQMKVKKSVLLKSLQFLRDHS